MNKVFEKVNPEKMGKAGKVGFGVAAAVLIYQGVKKLANLAANKIDEFIDEVNNEVESRESPKNSTTTVEMKTPKDTKDTARVSKKPRKSSAKTQTEIVFGKRVKDLSRAEMKIYSRWTSYKSVNKSKISLKDFIELKKD